MGRRADSLREKADEEVIISVNRSGGGGYDDVRRLERLWHEIDYCCDSLLRRGGLAFLGDVHYPERDCKYQEIVSAVEFSAGLRRDFLRNGADIRGDGLGLTHSGYFDLAL